MTFADEPNTSTEVEIKAERTERRSIKRSLTLVAPSSGTAPDEELDACSTSARPDVSPTTLEDDFSILRLDLNLGAARHAQSLISQLERSSISSLLDTRLAASLSHLALLSTRIRDAQSRVLVTGDLNAGKSTLINALLRRRDVMPTDQQPLTTRFVEVISAKENGDKEEIHVIEESDGETKASETRPVEDLEALVLDAEADASSAPLRVYLREAASDMTNPSILHNGVVDISLIDAPGLNRDSVKTTALFARQEEIDVIVFVVSAANHFTLSAKEFIWQAGHEKAHLFIVVNRFDQIRDKERCRRVVLEQIKQLSPRTYEDAANLVHFVDSAKVAFGFSEEVGCDTGEELDEAFSHLEHSLRSFVLVNRAQSKLGPAETYLGHLMADVELLAGANALVATAERDQAREEVLRLKPVLEKMRRGREGLEEGVVDEEEDVSNKASLVATRALSEGLSRVARGEPAITIPGKSMPSYPGVLGVWNYAQEVRHALLRSLDAAVLHVETEVKAITSEGVAGVVRLGEKHLPPDVERSQRVFNPDAMFAVRPSRSLVRRASGVTSLGLGLAQRSDLVEINVSDIFDLYHQLLLVKTTFAGDQSSDAHEISGLGVISVAIGALTMIGGKTLGARSLLEGAIHFTDFASNPAARRWAVPVIGIAAFAGAAYLVMDLPNSIPRNVGRQLQAALQVSAGPTDPDTSFVDAQAARVQKEARKVMRLASWDLKERFRGALETRGAAVREAEATEKKAARALDWFTHVNDRVECIRTRMGDSKK
jgi:mitofusin